NMNETGFIYLLLAIAFGCGFLTCHAFAKTKERHKKQINKKNDSPYYLGEGGLFETILNSVPVTVSIKDTDYKYIFVNQYQADMLYKIPPSETVGKTASELINKSYGSYTTNNDQTVISTGKALTNYEETIPDVNGKEYNVVTTKSPIFDEDGKVRAIITISMDLSAQKHAETKLQESLALAENANISKSNFIASMSHELRTPLNAIIGFSDMMRQEIYGHIKNKKYMEYLDDIHASGSLLLDMVNDILELSKLESEQFNYATESYNVTEFSKEIVERFKRSQSNNNVDFSVQVSPDVPKKLTANKKMQTQIHLNLLSNAYKHVDKESGKIIFDWSVINQDKIQLQVIDNGSGMSEETIEQIGQPFMLGDDAYKAKHEYVGIGLGLYVTKKIIEARGGSLSIESQLGEGSTFKICWPLSTLTPSS
ncbi:PAS domain-containing sensor histidine kinase, partial [Curvivirga aplysinae]|uniref:PAS domain-containing sensor histidine kinase n=1 Tax=Curvivirga aplysinae TaxID=2529852 RepID=UPI0012BB8B4F